MYTLIWWEGVENVPPLPHTHTHTHPTMHGRCPQDLQSRVARQQFSCACGVGFDFQDDMEVHQVRLMWSVLLWSAVSDTHMYMCVQYDAHM